MNDICKESVGDIWSKRRCGKPVYEIIDGNPLCKSHAKRYRIRRGMDTGESLETRYFIYDLSIIEINGVITKKIFSVRNNRVVFGDCFFFKTNIPLDTKYMFVALQDAKDELARQIRKKIVKLRGEIENMEARLKKVEA